MIRAGKKAAGFPEPPARVPAEADSRADGTAPIETMGKNQNPCLLDSVYRWVSLRRAQ
jgi:hypothetical protein